jgi:hypothetical protein
MIIALQVTATAILWFLAPITQAATDTFALYLSVDLVGFAMLSYQYRVTKAGRGASQAWLALGYLAMVTLLASNLVII